MNVQGDQAPAKRQKMMKKFENSSTKTVTEHADTIWISYGVCQSLTENLNMRCIAAKFVPRLLTNDQKQRHVNVYLEQ
jgi:hypothetical protein